MLLRYSFNPRHGASRHHDLRRCQHAIVGQSAYGFADDENDGQKGEESLRLGKRVTLGWRPQGIPQWFTVGDDIHNIIGGFNRPQIGMKGHKAPSPDRGCFRRAYCVVAILFMTVHPVFADELRRALLVSPYDSALPALVRVEAGIREELESELPNVEIYTEYLDIERFSNAQYAAQLAVFLRDKYARRPIDVVIAMAPEGLDFLMKRRDFLFPQSKLMFTRLTEDELNVWHVPPEIPGIISRYDPAPTVDLALHLQPEATRLIILMGTTDAERHEAAVTPDRLKAFAHRLEITYWSNLAMAEVSRAVAKLPKGTFVLDLGIRRDGAGQFFIPRDVDQKLAAQASVPFYAGYETVVGRGNRGVNLSGTARRQRSTFGKPRAALHGLSVESSAVGHWVGCRDSTPS
jgi:hypothetical protein